MIVLFCLRAVPAQAQQSPLALQFTPEKTTVNFTLTATLHTVHGEFKEKSGTVHFDPATGAIGGEIVIDATSGHTGNQGRDRRMHREILETAIYPEIVFRPDRVQGTLAASGFSDLQVHGIFTLHGSEHEATLPIRVQMTSDHWSAAAHFVIPYVQWGVKNPSTLLLHVGPTVDVDVEAAGPIPGR